MLTLLIGKIISSDKKKIKKIFFSPFFHLFPLYKAGTILGRSFNEKYVLNSFNSNLEPRVFFKSCPFLHFYRICTLCLLTKQIFKLKSFLNIVFFEQKLIYIISLYIYFLKLTDRFIKAQTKWLKVESEILRGG